MGFGRLTVQLLFTKDTTCGYLQAMERTPQYAAAHKANEFQMQESQTDSAVFVGVERRVTRVRGKGTKEW
jgi:hypothetical protein